jgi:hypothetical protein
MLIRISSALVLISLFLLVRMILEPTGETAIPFSFIGMPTVGLGILIYFIAALLARREQAETSEE